VSRAATLPEPGFDLDHEPPCAALRLAEIRGGSRWTLRRARRAQPQSIRPYTPQHERKVRRLSSKQ